MNTIKLNILFVISASRIRKDNKAPVNCRLTYNKKRKQFSTGIFITPANLNSKQQLVKPPEPDSELLNTQLSPIKTLVFLDRLLLQNQSRLT